MSSKPTKTDSNPALGLAERIRRAASKRTEDAELRAKLELRRAERLEAEVSLLLDRLQEVGEAAEVLTVVRGDRSLRLGLDDLFVAIHQAPGKEGSSRLEIEATGVEATTWAMYNHEIEAWVLHIEREARASRRLRRSPTYERQLPLLNEGMEWLISRGLALRLEEP